MVNVLHVLRTRGVMFGVCSFLMICMTGCSKKNCIRFFAAQEIGQVSDELKHNKQCLAILEELLMRTPDIPLPLQAHLSPDFGGPDAQGSFYFCYSTVQSSQQLLQFYKIEMEHLGWNLTSLFSLIGVDQHSAVFQKPYHQAVIIMHLSPNDNLTSVTFYFLQTQHSDVAL